jgi:hypothetical protein
MGGEFGGLGRAGFSSLQLFIDMDVMSCCWEVGGAYTNVHFDMIYESGSSFYCSVLINL